MPLQHCIPTWMARRELVAVEHLEGWDGSNAIAVADGAGRYLAIWAPDFSPGHRLAPVLETAELAALFDQPPDQWFAPRVRGLVCGTVFAIRHGWPTAREGRDAMDVVLEGRGFLSRTALRFLRVLSWDIRSPLQGQSVLHEAREAFAEVIGRGRPVDETRAFFLGEIVALARDNGLELALPQRRGDTVDTPLFALVRAMIDIVINRVLEAGTPATEVRHRLAPVRASRDTLIVAVVRARDSENPQQNQ